MRKLMIAAVSLSLAVFLAYYLLPLDLLLPGAAAGAAAFVLLLPVRKKRAPLYRISLCALGAALGFSAYLLHWNGTLRYAERWDGSEQTLQVRVMEAPTAGKTYTSLHVQRMETPKLDLMLYDYQGETQKGQLKPGDVLTVTAKLRRADLRYGERNGNYISKDIVLTGTLRTLEPEGFRRQDLRTFAAACSRAVSDFASGFFPADTAVFMKALLLGTRRCTPGCAARDSCILSRSRGCISRFWSG